MKNAKEMINITYCQDCPNVSCDDCQMRVAQIEEFDGLTIRVKASKSTGEVLRSELMQLLLASYKLMKKAGLKE